MSNIYALYIAKYLKRLTCKMSINPISAGVLENQDMLGWGVKFDPPLNPMFVVKK